LEKCPQGELAGRLPYDLDVRDLIQTTPLVYDTDGLPVGYDASQLFGLESDYLGGRL